MRIRDLRRCNPEYRLYRSYRIHFSLHVHSMPVSLPGQIRIQEEQSAQPSQTSHGMPTASCNQNKQKSLSPRSVCCKFHATLDPPCLPLIVCSIHVVHSTSQTCIHDRQILIRKCDVHHKIRLILLDQCDHLIHIVRIYLAVVIFVSVFPSSLPPTHHILILFCSQYTAR